MSAPHGSDNRRLFDEVADTYQEALTRSVRRFGEDPGYFVERKLELILEVCGSPSPEHVLDVGCGVGLLTEQLARALPRARVTGFDVSARSVELAAARCRELENVRWDVCEAGLLPPDVDAADVVVVANVLHHLDPRARGAFLGLLARTLRPRGRLVVFEHNPYNPLTRLVVRACPFDRDAQLLSLPTAVALLQCHSLRVLRGDYIVFFPSVLRRLRSFEARIRWLPLGAQYMVVADAAPAPATA